jgi:hypothetical protein
MSVSETIRSFTIEPGTLLSDLLRPRQLGDLSQPQRIIDRLQKMVDTQSPMNMLFYGLAAWIWARRRLIRFQASIDGHDTV